MADLVPAMMLVFAAELGDKTQLVALGLGARYRLRLVLAGIAIAYLAAGVVSVAVGALIGAALPTRAVSIGGGLLFIGFAIWTIVQPSSNQETGSEVARAAEGGATRVVSSVAVAMFIAEFGDKTMLATATLASRGNPVAVFVGATVGIFLAGALGVYAGRAVGRRLSDRTVRSGSAALFGVFGVALIASAI
ncbi:MAG: TMEM165/GDT1 family protein [Ilumatobacter sp.]|uniref:TMEM165/GDT1 family protein n=1 Tax=Ilumatobacter sp. TaxID=1967498 RepID=UPI002606BE7E|nr:TMEM165/GDT1 family protein [Ilumatobacter sp.]MDJ0768142.1 TMEM165/GDT1 family protein [Ilumatobacter sp.]